MNPLKSKKSPSRQRSSYFLFNIQLETFIKQTGNETTFNLFYLNLINDEIKTLDLYKIILNLLFISTSI